MIPNSPADRVGLHIGHQVLVLNDHDLNGGESMDTIVALIQEAKQAAIPLTLEVIDNQEGYRALRKALEEVCFKHDMIFVLHQIVVDSIA